MLYPALLKFGIEITPRISRNRNHDGLLQDSRLSLKRISRIQGATVDTKDVPTEVFAAYV